MKKTLSLLLYIVMVEFCFGIEPYEPSFSESQFKSVNTLTTGVNYTPNITPVGAENVYVSEDIYPQARRINGVRRVDPTTDAGDPYTTPIEDIPLFALICFICLYIFWKKRKE